MLSSSDQKPWPLLCLSRKAVQTLLYLGSATCQLVPVTLLYQMITWCVFQVRWMENVTGHRFYIWMFFFFGKTNIQIWVCPAPTNITAAFCWHKHYILMGSHGSHCCYVWKYNNNWKIYFFSQIFLLTLLKPNMKESIEVATLSFWHKLSLHILHYYTK